MKSRLATFGWREWVDLPELGVRHVKAKVDTGARTSSLHASNIQIIEVDGILRARFSVHPHQHDTDDTVECEADVVDERDVRNSGGQAETRTVISTLIQVGAIEWPVEITLTARDDMKFRMLIGRTAMHGVATVDPSRSFVTSGRRRKRA